MNILEANSNILREITYTLRIVDGEAAQVFEGGPDYFWPNPTLNNFGIYWPNFLATTPSTTVPIISIDSMYKTQSVWYRNESQYDELNITVDHDYNSNIIEFLNRGIKDYDLDYSSIDQLIFILEANIINSVGYSQTETIFVGRPSTDVNTEGKLSFKVNNLDYVSKGSTFENNVIRASSGSFFNFVSLKEAYERIYNMPHGIRDEYTYPVCPFDIDEDVYIPSTDAGIIETEQLLGTDKAYAEDVMLGNDSRLNVFFYRSSPECGFITKELNLDGTIVNQYTTYMNSLKLFTNQDDLDNISVDNPAGLQRYNGYSNVFRCFRPIRTFVSRDEVLTMKVGSVDINSTVAINLVGATTDQYKIDVDDEILVLEMVADYNPVNGRNILFNSTCHVFYYNLSKNCMYWNAMVMNASSIPFPKQWLDMSSYNGLPTFYDIQINIGQLGYADFWFSRTYGVRKGHDNNWDFHIGYSALSGYQQNITVEKDSMMAYQSDTFGPGGTKEWTERFISNPVDKASMGVMLDQICKVHPKSIKFSEEYQILYGTQRVRLFNDDDINGNYFWTCVKTSMFVVDVAKAVIWIQNDAPGALGFLYEIGTTTSTHQTFFVETTQQINDVFSIKEHAVVFFDKEDPRYLVQSNTDYKSANLYRNLDTDGQLRTYFPYYETIMRTNGSYIDIYAQKTSNVLILDVNIQLDRMIYKDTTTNKVNYAVISTDVIIYEDITSHWDIDYLYSMDRGVYFTNTENNNLYTSYSNIDSASIRLLSYTGDRYSAAFGLANSYFKNMYSNNLGIKKIGFEQPKSLTLTDSIIKTIDIKPYTYNNIEYNTYDVEKNNGVSLDNEVAVTEDDDDLTYDEAKDVYFYANKDVNFSNFSITRNSSNMSWVFTNEFGTETGDVDPSTYNTFQIPLEGIFQDIIIYFNFFDTQLEVGEVFRGSITRRNMILNNTPKMITSIDKKYIWKDDNNIAFRFPFLTNKNSDLFKTELEKYWLDTNDNIRKLTKVEVVVDELLLFNTNYSVFNLGEQRVTIDSKTKYLNGYGLNYSTPIPFNDNRASFYIEKATYNFKQKTTKLILISV